MKIPVRKGADNVNFWGCRNGFFFCYTWRANFHPVFVILAQFSIILLYLQLVILELFLVFCYSFLVIPSFLLKFLLYLILLYNLISITKKCKEKMVYWPFEIFTLLIPPIFLLYLSWLYLEIFEIFVIPPVCYTGFQKYNKKQV